MHCSTDPNSAINSNEEYLCPNDAAWILSNTIRILGMQTGFGMLEAGMVSSKNIANIMVKNVIDVTVGGFTYWIFGYALSFGKPSNWFCGYGNFFFNADDLSDSGSQYTKFFFHFSFATASTTIISGAAAERMTMSAYILFSAINTFIYSIPASWAWNDTGFLKGLGFYDFAGGGVVHLTGGASALVAALMLGPRLGKFTDDQTGPSHASTMSSPVTSLVGMFTLWWAWFAFSCGSTFGIQNDLWRIAAKVAVTTSGGSIGGSLAGLFLTILVNRKDVFFDIGYLISSILGGLVSVTSGGAIYGPGESILVGFVGGILAIGGTHALRKLKIDDPVCAVPVHFVAAFWSVIAVGLFGKDHQNLFVSHKGMFFGGGPYFFGVQVFGSLVLASWSLTTTFVVLMALKNTMGIRTPENNELLGADWVEHHIQAENLAQNLENALAALEERNQKEREIASNVIEELRNAQKDKHVASHVQPFPVAESSKGARVWTGKVSPLNSTLESNEKKQEEKLSEYIDTDNAENLPGTTSDFKKMFEHS